MTRRKLKKKARKYLFLFFLALFLFSAIMLTRSLWEYRKESKAHSRLEDDFLVFEETEWDVSDETLPAHLFPDATTAEILDNNDAVTDAPPQLDPSTVQPEASSPVFTQAPLENEATTAPATAATTVRLKEQWPNFAVNWDALFKRNPDVIGWIWMFDSTISYPVLLGEDNDEYLRTTIDGEYAKFGSIFADYRSTADFSGRNTIIYGHNGGYGVKFGGLMSYQYKSHWDNHRYVCIMTPSGLAKYYIYSAYITKAEGNPYKTVFPTDSDYQSFIDKTVSSSLYSTGVVPTVADRILTLSTCTNNASDERLVIHAVRVN